MLKYVLHAIGVHRWRFSHGSHHRYFECTLCGQRKIKLEVGGHQPIDHHWLAGGSEAERPPLRPPRGGSAVCHFGFRGLPRALRPPRRERATRES